MPLISKRKVFFVTADTTNLLANDNELGACGRGLYRIWAVAAAAADATITVRDANSAVLNAVSIPVKAAAVTYPDINRQEDPYWDVRYNGAGDVLPIDIADGTNAEITVTVEYLGG